VDFGLQLAGVAEGGQALDMLAVAPAEEALALAGRALGGQVDVVPLAVDLLEAERLAEIDGDGVDEVGKRRLADGDDDDAGFRFGGRGDEPDEAGRLRPGLALTGRGGGA
jgi:hypothetical protein